MLEEQAGMQLEEDNSNVAGYLDTEKIVLDIGLVQQMVDIGRVKQTGDMDLVQWMLDIGQVQQTVDTWMDWNHMDQTEEQIEMAVGVDSFLFEVDMGGQVDPEDKYLALDNPVVLHFQMDTVDKVGNQAVVIQVDLGIPTIKKKNS